MTDPTPRYGQLDATLRNLGFTCRVKEKEYRAYKHEASGAIVLLPDYPDSKEASPVHVAVVRSTLDDFGFAAPEDFAAMLQKAS